MCYITLNPFCFLNYTALIKKNKQKNPCYFRSASSGENILLLETFGKEVLNCVISNTHGLARLLCLLLLMINLYWFTFYTKCVDLLGPSDAYIWVGKLTIFGSDNGLSPGRHQAIIWANVGKLLIGPLRTNLSEILIGIQAFSFRKMHFKMSSAKWRPFCRGINVLIQVLNINEMVQKRRYSLRSFNTYCL